VDEVLALPRLVRVGGLDSRTHDDESSSNVSEKVALRAAMLLAL